MNSISEYLLCRLCLRKGLSLIDITEESIENGFSIKGAVEDLLQFVVNKEEGFPWLVCPICCAKLDDFKNFKVQCLNSKRTFDSKFTPKDSLVDKDQNTQMIDIVDVKIEPEDPENQSDSYSTVVCMPIGPEDDEMVSDDHLSTEVGFMPFDHDDEERIVSDHRTKVRRAIAGSEKKKIKRESMTLLKKKEVLDKLGAGRRVVDLAREYGVNESTIRTIRRNKESIEVSLFSAATTCGTIRSMCNRSVQLNKTERLLKSWIEEQTEKGLALSSSSIRDKAARIYGIVCEQEGEPSKYCQFSGGWFDKFKKRTNLHSPKFGDGTCVDHQAAEQYHEEFLRISEGNNYHPHQVFNADETVLFWKKMPGSTYITKQESVAPGFKAAKDYVTLLFCANASGDFKCKPMLVYHSETPRALKNKDKSLLPVHWRSNRKTWVTAAMFTHWFNSSFVVEVKEYLAKKGLPFKVLLVLDNAPCHPPSVLRVINPDVQVVFMPPYTTSLLQPLSRGVFRTFKCFYVRRILRKLLKAVKEDPEKDLIDIWHGFNIGHAIEDIRVTWDEVPQSTVNSGWGKLWPSIVGNFVSFPTQKSELREIVLLSRALGGEGFDDMTEEEIEELVDSAAEELTEEEMLQMLESHE